MNAVTEFRPAPKHSLLTRMADRYGVEPEKMMATLKATAFKGEVSNEQMMALLIVAEQYNLNPWTKEIYAFPSRQGIVPIVGVDGWLRIINDNPNFDGMDFDEAPDGSYIKCSIHRKDRTHPVVATEWFAECNRNTDPWKSHPRRMLRHKAVIQAARMAFGFSGIYDQDEGERILEAVSVEAKRIDPRGDVSDIPVEMVMKHVGAITDLLNADKDENGIADSLREYEREALQPFPEVYICVQDRLAKEGVISKANWRKWLKVGMDRGETHTA